MTLTDRQKQILDRIVSEYIRLARPISSQLLEEEYDFGFSPATLRKEMLALGEQGFLNKPYLSSGRIPTDRGYRFFVDEILEENGEEPAQLNWETPFQLARNLNSLTSALATLYVPGQDVFFKEGWESVLAEPEFGDRDTLRSFTKFMKDFEEFMPGIPSGFKMKIFIGEENPFSKVEDFSIMIAECDLEGTKVFVALAGPKRMAYKRNIRTLRQAQGKKVWNKKKQSKH